MSWIEIFNPGYRYTVEERQRKRIEAQIPGSEGNPLGVDLDKGVIRVVLPATGSASDVDHEDDHKHDEDRIQGGS